MFGFLLNWPLAVFLLLAASTALAVAQNGVGSPVFWIGLGLAVLATAGLAALYRRARATGPALERALDEGLGADWRDGVDAGLAARLRRRPSLARVLLAPISFRGRIERIANLRYGPARRGNLLDVYRDRSGRSGRPTLVYLHGGAFRFGSKRFGARHLLNRLAADGWVCISANYRLRGTGFAEPLMDVEKVIAWVREHGREYGADPTSLFLAGSSAGGQLALRAALAPDEPGGKTPVAGLVHAVTLLLVILVAAPLARDVPLSVLAGILLVVAYNMGDWAEVPEILKLSKNDISVWLATFALTVFADLSVAVEVGMILAALLMIRKIALTTTVTEETKDEVEAARVHLMQGKTVPDYVTVFRIQGPFLFGGLDKLSVITDQLRMLPPIVILRLRNMTALDGSGLGALEDLADELQATGRTLILCGAREQPAKLMDQAEFDEHVGHENICADLDQALARARTVRAGTAAAAASSAR